MGWMIIDRDNGDGISNSHGLLRISSGSDKYNFGKGKNIQEFGNKLANVEDIERFGKINFTPKRRLVQFYWPGRRYWLSIVSQVSGGTLRWRFKLPFIC